MVVPAPAYGCPRSSDCRLRSLEAQRFLGGPRRALVSTIDEEVTVPELPDDIYFDSNGVLTERRWITGQDVVVHYDDVPETDITVVQGIPCTTALRTVIDLAPDIDRLELHHMVQDCLDRHLFTLEEAETRLAHPDMQHRRGAELLRLVLLR
jgi:hypothetical protein